MANNTFARRAVGLLEGAGQEARLVATVDGQGVTRVLAEASSVGLATMLCLLIERNPEAHALALKALQRQGEAARLTSYLAAKTQ